MQSARSERCDRAAIQTPDWHNDLAQRSAKDLDLQRRERGMWIADQRAMKTFDRLLRALTLLPFGLLGAAACGGSVFESAAGGAGHGGAGTAGSGAAGASAGSAAGGAAGLMNLAGASSAGANSGGSSSAGAGSGGSSGAIGSGGSAGVDLRACTSSSECQVAPVSCCNCGTGPVSAYTSINAKHSMEYLNRCQTADCAPCPPVAYQVDNPVFYYVPTCQAHECEVVDLRSDSNDITACKQDSDCMLRAGAGCCPNCGGSAPIAIGVGKEPVLEKLVCGNEPVGCLECAPTFTGYAAQCSAGQCRVQLAPCGAGQPCGG